MTPRRYTVELAASAGRAFRKLDPSTQHQLARAIDSLSENPRPHRSIRLKGAEDIYRIRSGNYRILYTIEDRRLLVLVVAIGHRREIYRRSQ
ncbi:MAG: type II toxin-antitoxin system RelE/ParE family toxin [Gemmatimonadales bacterium]